MGLKSDIDEVMANLDKLPPLQKVWHAFSGFLSVSAIASLSEDVAKWKGFIKVAIEFYQSWIANPIKYGVWCLFHADISKFSVDALILFFVLTASLQNSICLGTDWNNKGERYGTWAGATYSVFFYCCVFYWVASNQEQFNKNSYIELVTYSVLCFGILPFIGSGRKSAKMFYLQVAVLVGFVCILGAINSGLAK